MKDIIIYLLFFQSLIQYQIKIYYTSLLHRQKYV